MTRARLRVGCAVLAALCVGFLAVGSVANETVLSSAYYRTVIDGENTYSRVYDEILVDPQAARLTEDLLAGLPVGRAQLLANLKIVLPPAMLRAIVDRQIAATLRYVTGETDTFALRVDLTPVIDNIAHLAEQYLGDLVATLQKQKTPDFSAFLRSLQQALDELERGQTLSSLPTVPLTAQQAAVAAGVVLRPVDPESRARLLPVVTSALEAGDIAGALAAAGPFVLAPRTASAVRDLLDQTGDVSWDAAPALRRAGASFSAVHTARAFARWISWPAQIVTLLLGAAALFGAFRLNRGATTRRRLTECAAALAAGGVLALGGLFVLRHLVSGIFPPPAAGWPPSLRELVDDLEGRATGEVVSTGLVAALLPLGVGILVIIAAAVRRESQISRLVVRHRRFALAVLGAVVVVTLVGETLTPLVARRQPLRCEGSVALCHLRYDQTAFLATHNAMATTADGFLGPFQDPTITQQLDEGARALLIDTHTWERSDQILDRIRSSDLPPDVQARLPSLIDSVDPPRPGLWLCHVLCRAGATPFVSALVALRRWLDDHRDAVVTLIIEDDITGLQTQEAFEKAGLLPRIVTPPDRPAARWPTLGELVRSDKRLVVFSQRTNGPARWYRKFYDFGMETPFDVPSPDAMSCAPERGGEDKRLFLLNHFVSRSGSSRLAAAQVNRAQLIVDRAHVCQAARGALVTFVAVDFANLGDARNAVDELNRERASAESAGRTD